jgi:GNAT superfamily N-acetyltransferase
LGITYKAPEPLNPEHKIDFFDCGETSLNNWLKERAIKSESTGAARTYVVCADNRVVGYYCLSTGSVMRDQAPGKIKQNMPDPIPVIIVGRLAVDRNHQGQGLGKALIKDAVLRSLQASVIAGIRAILVHALNEKAKQFYTEKCGFISSRLDPLTLMLNLSEAQKSLDRS